MYFYFYLIVFYLFIYLFSFFSGGRVGVAHRVAHRPGPRFCLHPAILTGRRSEDRGDRNLHKRFYYDSKWIMRWNETPLMFKYKGALFVILSWAKLGDRESIGTDFVCLTARVISQSTLRDHCASNTQPCPARGFWHFSYCKRKLIYANKRMPQNCNGSHDFPLSSTGIRPATLLNSKLVREGFLLLGMAKKTPRVTQSTFPWNFIST